MHEAMNYDDFAGKLIFSDEAAFHLSENFNSHKVRVWNAELLHVRLQVERNSPKLNVFVGMLQSYMDPFFFIVPIVTGRIYPDMLQLWLFPQLT